LLNVLVQIANKMGLQKKNLVDIMHRNRFSLHCALLPVRDLVRHRDKGNRVKLHPMQYRAANFMILMEDSKFHAHPVTVKKLGAVDGWI
jgi:hypothetical protein